MTEAIPGIRSGPGHRRAPGPDLQAVSAAMFVSIAAGLLPFSVSPAGAQARPDARTMACADLRELVFGRGAVVITTGERNFARFVESQLFCQPVAEIAEPAFVGTRDNPECWIGYLCRNRSDLNR